MVYSSVPCDARYKIFKFEKKRYYNARLGKLEFPSDLGVTDLKTTKTGAACTGVKTEGEVVQTGGR